MARKWVEKGVAYYKQGEYNKAIEAFNKAIVIDPKDGIASFGKGQAFSNLGEYDKAIEAFNKATAIDPNNKSLWYNKGVAFSKLGEYDKAIEAFNKAIAIDPNDGSAWFAKGHVFSESGEYDKAIEAFNKAIAIDPNDGLAWGSKGVAFTKLGGYNKAIEAFNKAIAIDPNDGLAWFAKGEAFDELGEYDKAIEAFNKAIAIDPAYKDANEMKDLAAKKSDAPKNANNTDYKINKWKVFCQKCGAELNEKANFCRSCGFPQQEVIIIDVKNWKWKPKRWWIGLIIFWLFSTIGAGLIARSGGSYGEESGFIIFTMLIFTVWAACTDRSWSIPKRIIWVFGVWIGQGILTILIIFIIIILLGDYLSVEPHLFDRMGAFLAAFPLVVWAMWRSKFFVEPVVKKEEIQAAWKNKGSILDELGKYEEALACYDKALKINPKDGEAWVNKGIVFGNLGKPEESLACYDKALEINPLDDDIWFNKACSESKLNNTIKAIEYLGRAIELNIKNKESAVKDKDFDNIRYDKRFIELVNNFTKN